MQAISLNSSDPVYHEGVKTGRPPKQPRSSFGARLLALREDAGLSQGEVAQKLDVPQRTYAYWERADVALRADQLGALADLFNVSCDFLVGRTASKARGKGPTGKLKKAFDQAATLPKRRQQRVVEMVEDMVTAQEAQAS